jgi:hypothetical protein
MLDKEEEKKHADNIENKLAKLYGSIPDYAQALEVIEEEKIQKIA